MGLNGEFPQWEHPLRIGDDHGNLAVICDSTSPSTSGMFVDVKWPIVLPQLALV